MINGILERTDKVSRGGAKLLILRLYNGGDIAGWVTEMKLPIATTGVLEQLLKGIRAELVRFAEHVVGNPKKVSE